MSSFWRKHLCSVILISIFSVFVIALGLVSKFAYVDYMDRQVSGNCGITSCQESNSTCLDTYAGRHVEYECFRYCYGYSLVLRGVAHNDSACTNYGYRQNFCNQTTIPCYYVDNQKTGRFVLSLYPGIQLYDENRIWIILLGIGSGCFFVASGFWGCLTGFWCIGCEDCCERCCPCD